jgi:hypothetical protein
MATKSNHPFHNGNEKKFLDSMNRGIEYSRKQAQHIFKLKNPSAALIRFEDMGYEISRTYFMDKKAGTYKVRYSID